MGSVIDPSQRQNSVIPSSGLASTSQDRIFGADVVIGGLVVSVDGLWLVIETQFTNGSHGIPPSLAVTVGSRDDCGANEVVDDITGKLVEEIADVEEKLPDTGGSSNGGDAVAV
jgi:hypothetical protein